MNQSESIENLAKALTALQAELPIIPFDSVNPYYKSDYASLKAILGVVRPLLLKHDLTVTQLPSSPYPNPLEVSTITAAVPNAPSTSRAFALAGLSTRLIHSSGEWIEDEVYVPIEADPRVAQVVGGIITYLRRYSLSALLGIITDEDTDGNEPEKNTKAQPEGKKPSDNGQPNGKNDNLMSPQRFVEYCQKNIAVTMKEGVRYLAANIIKDTNQALYFASTEHIRRTMRLIGYKAVPRDKNKRRDIYGLLSLYATARNNGKTQDDALAALQDEPEAVDTPV